MVRRLGGDVQRGRGDQIRRKMREGVAHAETFG
jgi:hypothetical protein